jgi:hypothetical protein
MIPSDTSTAAQRLLFTDAGSTGMAPADAPLTSRGVGPAPCCIPQSASPFGEHKEKRPPAASRQHSAPCAHCGAVNWRSYTIPELVGGKLVDLPTVYCADCGEKR